MDNYILDVPEDLYYEILLHPLGEALINISNVRKFKYKKLFAIKFPKLFNIINELKNKQPALRQYSYKRLHCDVLELRKTSYKEYLKIINLQEPIDEYFNYIKGLSEVLYAYEISIKFPNMFEIVLCTTDITSMCSYRYLYNIICKYDNNILIKEWINKDYDYKYILRNYNFQEPMFEIRYEKYFLILCLNYLVNLKIVKIGQLQSKKLELERLLNKILSNSTSEVESNLYKYIFKIIDTKLEHMK